MFCADSSGQVDSAIYSQSFFIACLPVISYVLVIPSLDYVGRKLPVGKPHDLLTVLGNISLTLFCLLPVVGKPHTILTLDGRR